MVIKRIFCVAYPTEDEFSVSHATNIPQDVQQGQSPAAPGPHVSSVTLPAALLFSFLLKNDSLNEKKEEFEKPSKSKIEPRCGFIFSF
jgi:hypothetical protein